jgi:hypothetical protein
LDGGQLYGPITDFNPERAVSFWATRESFGSERGFEGFRFSGNLFREFAGEEWRALMDYESRVDQLIHGRRMLGLCSYGIALLSKTGFSENGN